jgi:Sec-independent protein translocase protein TatA
MAEMLTDLLQNIYSRIAQLGKAIQGLKNSLDGLNQNIEDKITNLNTKMENFAQEITVAQTKHLEVISEIGEGAKKEIEVVQEGLGLKNLKKMMSDMENFSKLAEEVLNQDTVNLLLSEAISSVKNLKQKQETQVVEQTTEKE